VNAAERSASSNGRRPQCTINAPAPHARHPPQPHPHPQVVVANWVAHQIHHEGVYESELERIGNLYFLRDEPPHRWGGGGQETAGDEEVRGVVQGGLRGFTMRGSSAPAKPHTLSIHPPIHSPPKAVHPNRRDDHGHARGGVPRHRARVTGGRAVRALPAAGVLSAGFAALRVGARKLCVL